MFKLTDEEALGRAFRPRDRRLLELPRGLAFPLVVHDYLAWAHPAGGRVFLVFAAPGGRPVGIAFDTNGQSAAVPAMCDWCRSSALGRQVGLLSTWADGKRRVGVNVCTDLSCKQKLAEAADLGGYSDRPAVEQVIARMARFASEGLGIEVGRG